MLYQKLYNTIKKHEGESLHPYFCSEGKLTIGIGRCLDTKGISKKESEFLFKTDIKEALKDLRGLFGDSFKTYPSDIQIVLTDMRFNLGFAGFRSFKRMIGAVRHREWVKMKYEMIDSVWFSQVNERALNLIRMVEQVIVNEIEKPTCFKSGYGTYKKCNICYLKQECESTKTVSKLFKDSIEI